MRASGRMLLCLLFAITALGHGCQSGDGADPSGYTEEDCSAACNRLAAADCGDVGQECFDRCVSFPMAQFVGDCQVQLRAYLDCSWHAESFTCDGGVTTPVGCDAARQAYLGCRSQGEGGAGGEADAGGAGMAAEPLGGAGATEQGGASQGDAGAEAVAAGAGSGGALP